MTCKYVQVNIERNQKCFSQARSHHLLCQYSSHRTTEHNASYVFDRWNFLNFLCFFSIQSTVALCETE